MFADRNLDLHLRNAGKYGEISLFYSTGCFVANSNAAFFIGSSARIIHIVQTYMVTNALIKTVG